MTEGKTTLVGIIGWPVAHSKSPKMHDAAFKALSLNYAYVPLPVAAENVKEAVLGLRALSFRGANVTVPYKEAVVPFLDALSPRAKAIGAVNTIVVQNDGTLFGDNTDAPGFTADLQNNHIRATERPAILLGAGGSARACAYGLLESGVKHIEILNRTVGKAQSIANAMLKIFPNEHIVARALDAKAMKEAGPNALIVNCTSLGLAATANEMAWRDDVAIMPKQVVYDLIYDPNPTTLLKKAANDGAKTVSGRGMLLHQGALAFELWTNQKAPVDVMKQALTAT